MTKTTDINLRQSEVIDAMRFPLIVLVVFIHTIGSEIKQIDWNSNLDLYLVISELNSHNIGRIAVPSFFLFSGYFFFFKMEKWSFTFYFMQLKKRVKTILLPFILWTIVFIAIILVKNAVFKLLGFETDDYLSRINIQSLSNIFWINLLNYPLWFLRDLICMSLLTPVFYYCFKYLKIFGLIILFLVYFLNLESNIPGLSTTAFMFFGIGAYMGLNKKNILALTIKIKEIAYIVSIALLGISLYFNGTSTHEYIVRAFVPFGIVVLINIVNTLCNNSDKIKAQLIKLSPTVFFIFGLHVIYIMNWIAGASVKIQTIFPDSMFLKITLYFCSPIIAISICLVIYYLMKRLFPKTLSLLLGSRS